MSAGRTISTSSGRDSSGRDTWALPVSIAVHVAVLAWGALTFAAKPLKSESTPMPVDIISVSEFSQLTSGSRTALKVEAAKPVADKIGERKPADDPAAKIAKTEVHAATDVPAPLPEPKPPTPPTPPEKTQSEPKRDLIAEAIKKDLAKKPEPKKSEPKKAEAKAEAKAETKPEPKAQPKKEQPKFDPRKVEALLDKRTPQRVAATGDVVNNTVGLGAPTGTALQLSQNELEALRARLAQLWNPPAGASNPEELVVVIRMRLKPDGTLAAPPGVISYGRSALSVAARDSAVRAIFRGQPFNMLRPETYELWKDIEINFDPRDMIRG